MDDVQKGRVRLTHWIDHNLDHLKGYVEVAHVLETHELGDAAQSIREGIRLIEAANAEFEKALAGIPANPEAMQHSHSTQGAASQPPHEHSHGHGHEHHHEHGHGHAHEHHGGDPHKPQG